MVFFSYIGFAEPSYPSTFWLKKKNLKLQEKKNPLSFRSSSCVLFAKQNGRDQSQEGLNREIRTERKHINNRKAMDQHFLWLFIDQIMEHK